MPYGLGFAVGPMAPASQALMCHFARQICEELVTRHAAIERQQVEESVHIHMALQKTK